MRGPGTEETITFLSWLRIKNLDMKSVLCLGVQKRSSVESLSRDILLQKHQKTAEGGRYWSKGTKFRLGGKSSEDLLYTVLHIVNAYTVLCT